MAVTFVRETDQQRTGEERTETVNVAGVHVRSFYVVVDDRADYSTVVLAAASLPAMGDSHPADVNSKVVNRQCTNRQDDPFVWDVRISYDVSGSPVQENPEVSWASVDRTIPVDSVFNAAGDPFDPPVMAESNYPELTITRNYLATDFTLTVANTLNGSVNSAGITIEGVSYSARVLRMVHVDRKLFFQNSTKYMRVTTRVRINKDTWDFKILNQGYRKKVSGVLRQILDPNTGTPVAKPALLKADGDVLAVGGAPTYITKRYYAEVDWAAQGLDLNY